MYTLRELPPIGSSEKRDSLFERIINTIIRWGGDTDSNAAVAGAVIGAYLGHSQLMMENPGLRPQAPPGGDQPDDFGRGATNFFSENIPIVLSADPNLGRIKTIGPAGKLNHPQHIPELSKGLAKMMRQNYAVPGK
jgi:hypothetical protein